jgi:hypothetical protein
MDGFELETLFDTFHPGVRFRKACEAVRTLPSLQPAGKVGPAFGNLAYEAIENALLPKPTSALMDAFRVVGDFADAFFRADSSIEQPFLNLLARHLSAVLLRTSNSSVHLTPLTIALDGSSAVRFLFPPAIKVGEKMFFPEVPFGARRPSWGGYLIGLVLCDMVDQLMRRPGPFTYDCRLIPEELRSSVVAQAKDVFERYFGVSPADLELRNSWNSY